MLDITRLIVQIGIILLASRGVGWIFRRLHQPQVVGEMVAGILLGPSLLGWAAPGLSASLFPQDSLKLLAAISQLGLVVYMFLVGLALNLDKLKEHTRSAILTSQLGIVVPFILGYFLAGYLYSKLSSPSVAPIHFALFLGIAMSITAFPVLARILTDRKMAHTNVGSVALTCAAVDDITAWCLLAALTLIVHATSATMPLWAMIGGTIAYVGAMIFAVRPILGRLLPARMSKHRDMPQDLLALILAGVLASAWVTERLGIHALFGAFLVGAILPRHKVLVSGLMRKLEDLVVVFFLPLFFALTGLRTTLTLLNGTEMWMLCGVIIAIAVIGKLGGAMTAARLTGLSWRDAGAIGILMNTRGLMEIVVLNIGLDLGIVSPSLFGMMIVMTLTTTFMTTPLLDWFYRGQPENNPLARPRVEWAKSHSH